MATLPPHHGRPPSPYSQRGTSTSPTAQIGRSTSSGTLNKRKEKKSDSFFEKIGGTLGRQKKQPQYGPDGRVIEEAEVTRVEYEGRQAIDLPGSPIPKELSPEDLELEDGEERALIALESRQDPKLMETQALLINWINDVLAPQRIVVKDLEEDLFDGQVLQKLVEFLSGMKIEMPEVTQNEEGQKLKLKLVLDRVDSFLPANNWQKSKWPLESIHSKNLVAILHLLIALALHFRAPIRFPEFLTIQIFVVQKRDGKIQWRLVSEEITTAQEELGLRGERDAFDTLFDHAPDKLQVVKSSLITFANKHLNKINLEVNDLDSQFHDGVYLVLLMGLLEGYFVPLYSFHLTPNTFDQKVHNVNFAFELMQDAGLGKPKARPEDIVNRDLKCTLRVLYNLFAKFKHND